MGIQQAYSTRDSMLISLVDCARTITRVTHNIVMTSLYTYMVRQWGMLCCCCHQMEPWIASSTWSTCHNCWLLIMSFATSHTVRKQMTLISRDRKASNSDTFWSTTVVCGRHTEMEPDWLKLKWREGLWWFYKREFFLWHHHYLIVCLTHLPS